MNINLKEHAQVLALHSHCKTFRPLVQHWVGSGSGKPPSEIARLVVSQLDSNGHFYILQPADAAVNSSVQQFVPQIKVIHKSPNNVRHS